MKHWEYKAVLTDGETGVRRHKDIGNFFYIFFHLVPCLTWGIKQLGDMLLPFGFFFYLEHSTSNWRMGAMTFFGNSLDVQPKAKFGHDLILTVIGCWVYNILFPFETHALGLQFAAIKYMETSQNSYIAGKSIDTHHLLPGTSPDWVLPVSFSGGIFYYSWKT